ncbi:MAG: NAD(P)H-hydrate epimerase [Alphaproteobacteria bacterium]
MLNTIFTSESSYELDRLCVRRGIKFSDLIENAGKSAFIKIEKKIIPSLKGFNKKILILCGPGNNGGDGLVIAKYLLKSRYKVDISFPILNKINKHTNEKLKNLDISAQKLNDLDLNKYSMIIDSIFGIGLNRNFSNNFIKIIEKINKTKSCKVSIDIASGINSDSGDLMPISIKANHTITFVAPKVGHYLLPGKINSGNIHVVSIGEKKSEISKAKRLSKVKLNTPESWVKNFKWPSMIDHKYKRGHILVKSGPLTSTGASRLAAVTALRAGAGAVTLASETNALVVNASHLTSVMLKEINSTEEFFNFVKEKKIKTLIIGTGKRGQSNGQRVSYKSN